MSGDLEKLLLAERKAKRYLAELRSVRKRFVGLKDAESVKKLAAIDAEIAAVLR